MHIKVQSLNSNEKYCCNRKDIEAFFSGEDIDIYFGAGMSREEQRNNEKYQQIKNGDDRILAYMVVHKTRINNLGLRTASFLRIFILQQYGLENKLYERFRLDALPYLHKFFLSHKEDDDVLNNGAFCVTVGFNGQELKFYEGTVNRML